MMIMNMMMIIDGRSLRKDPTTRVVVRCIHDEQDFIEHIRL